MGGEGEGLVVVIARNGWYFTCHIMGRFYQLYYYLALRNMISLLDTSHYDMIYDILHLNISDIQFFILGFIS